MARVAREISGMIEREGGTVVRTRYSGKHMVIDYLTPDGRSAHATVHFGERIPRWLYAHIRSQIRRMMRGRESAYRRKGASPQRS